MSLIQPRQELNEKQMVILDKLKENVAKQNKNKKQKKQKPVIVKVEKPKKKSKNGNMISKRKLQQIQKRANKFIEVLEKNKSEMKIISDIVKVALENNN
jgi:hypothetical protein